MKKLLAIILALVTVLSLCACGGKEAGGNNYLTADGKVELTVGVTSSALIMDLDNNALTKWIEEKCGVEIKFKEYAGGTDVPTQISAAIAARQDLPDILFSCNVGETAMNRYGEEGYFLDLQDYFADKEGASKIFWDRMENELTEDQQELVISTITNSETGAIYSVPCVETSLVDKMGFQAWINVQWLDKLNLEKPTSWEELLKVLRAFRDNDCNGNGKKNDEIPLFGGESGGMSGDVQSWIMNMCTYWNKYRSWMVNENGELYMPWTEDGYREGIRRINQLYKEGLLTNMAWTVKGNEMRTITTPTNGEAICGIFMAHLTVQTQQGNMVLKEYEPLKTWGYAIRRDPSVSMSTYITDSCDEGKRDKAFEVLMTLWSWDGSMRQRYGEYGVNWEDPDPGAKSDMNLDATYKLNNDPFSQQNTCRWPGMCALNINAECETAQVGAMDEWTALRCALHAKSYELFCEAEATNPVDIIAKPFSLSQQEEEDIALTATNVETYREKAYVDFCKGETLDINSDADWNAYINELNKLGLKEYIAAHQKAYDREA